MIVEFAEKSQKQRREERQTEDLVFVVFSRIFGMKELVSG